MNKLKVEVEINCDGEKCGECKYLWPRFSDGYNWYCNLFLLPCGERLINGKLVPHRIDDCLDAEAHPLAETIAAIGAAGNKKEDNND